MPYHSINIITLYCYSVILFWIRERNIRKYLLGNCEGQYYYVSTIFLFIEHIEHIEHNCLPCFHYLEYKLCFGDPFFSLSVLVLLLIINMFSSRHLTFDIKPFSGFWGDQGKVIKWPEKKCVQSFITFRHIEILQTSVSFYNTIFNYVFF